MSDLLAHSPVPSPPAPVGGDGRRRPGRGLGLLVSGLAALLCSAALVWHGAGATWSASTAAPGTAGSPARWP